MQTANLEKVSKAVRHAAKKGLDAGMLTDLEDLGEAWKSIIKGLGTFVGASYMSYGLGDQLLAIVECSNGFEVGTGEALRPYMRHYRGTSEPAAVNTFLNKADEFVGLIVTG